MKKVAFSLLLALLSLLALSGCGCSHEWAEADCLTPKSCKLCQKTEGEALGHKWQDATCTSPKNCAICALTEGDPLPHTPGEIEASTDYIRAIKVETQSCLDCGAVFDNSETTISMVDGDRFCLSPEEFVQRLNHIYTSTGRTDWHADLEEKTDEVGDYCMVSMCCGDVVYGRVLFESLDPAVTELKKDDRAISYFVIQILPIDIAAQMNEDTGSLFDQAAALYKDENLFLDILNPVFQTLSPGMSEADTNEFIKNGYQDTRSFDHPEDYFFHSIFGDVYIEFADFIANLAYNRSYYVSICTSDEIWTNPE